MKSGRKRAGRQELPGPTVCVRFRNQSPEPLQAERRTNETSSSRRTRAYSLGPRDIGAPELAGLFEFQRFDRINCAARVAGSVPNSTPTMMDVAKAITTDQAEIGMG